MKTSELTGPALDWAVAKCEGELLRNDYYTHESEGVFMLESGEVSWVYSPSTKWNQGGPIIEREVVSLGKEEGAWRALCWGVDGPNPELYSMNGPTPLIAAMRAYVASRLGDEVEVPEELK